MNISLSKFFSEGVFLNKIKAGDYWELTKPRLVFLVLLSTVVGYFLAEEGGLRAWLFFPMLVGTALVAGGSMALNEWMERQEDANMPRTAGRPLPTQRLTPQQGLVFGLMLSITGLWMLEALVNSMSALLAGLTLSSYIFLYTPLKKITSLCTLVGAIPGALPPLIGWTAAGQGINFQAWILFFILFLWQLPHFLAIAWLYRKQYESAGFRMLSCDDPEGKMVGRQMLIYALALLPVSLLPTLAEMTRSFYFFGALSLGFIFIVLTLWAVRQLNQRAKPLFLASVLHLAVLLILMVADKA